MRTSAVLLLIAASAFAEDKPKKYVGVPQLWAATAEVGQYGPIVRDHKWDGADGSFREYTIEEIASKTRMVIREEVGVGQARKTMRFVVEGLDTSKLVTDRRFDLNGFFKISGTTKRGRTTILVLESVDDKELKRLEDAEKGR